MKNRADTRINKNNTINILNQNTAAFEKLTLAVENLTKIIKEHDERLTKLENK